MRLPFCVLLSFFALPIFAQSDMFTPSFYALQAAAGTEIFMPVESDFKAAKIIEQPYQNYQAAIRSRKEKLEIRYAVTPFQENNPLTYSPQVQMMRTVMSAGSNDEEAVVAYHKISEDDLDFFNADAGKTAFFRPKTGFSSMPFCKLVTLYKEGYGTVSVFFLFEDADNPAVDNRYYGLRFAEE